MKSKQKTKTEVQEKPKSKKKSWEEKFQVDRQAEVKVVDKDFADIPAGSKMLIATPAIIDEYVRSVPKGKSVELATLRKDLATEFNAEYTCPVTTGIFLRIASEVAYQQYIDGKPLSKIAPFWRLVSTKSPLAKKLSCGPDFIKEQREKEGLKP